MTEQGSKAVFIYLFIKGCQRVKNVYCAAVGSGRVNMEFSAHWKIEYPYDYQNTIAN